MGCSSSKPSIEPSVPAPEKPQSSQPTSIPDETTSTPSPGPGTAKNARAQYQDTALSQRRHDDDRQEMGSRQYPSGGTGPVQRTMSV